MDEKKTVKNDLETAAILMLTIDSDDSAAVLKHLTPKQIQKLAGAMAVLKEIDSNKFNDAVKSFYDEIRSQTSICVGIDEKLKTLMTKSLGPEKGQGFYNQLFENKSAAHLNGFDVLRWMDPYSVSQLIQNEHPQMQSVILSQLNSDQAAAALSYLNADSQTEILMRLATQDSIPSDALAELDQIIKNQFQQINSKKQHTVNGIKNTATIMNYIKPEQEQLLMQRIVDTDPELGTKIQDAMFVFEDLLRLDDFSLQLILREVPMNMLTLSIKGADETMRAKISKNLSKKNLSILEDELQVMRVAKVIDVENAQKEIIKLAKRLSDEGKISIALSK